MVEAGRYRFVGRVITKGEGSGAVCLRISGERNPHYVRSATWTDLNYEFEVDQDIREVDLVCEMTGESEAWFDIASLKLIKQE